MRFQSCHLHASFISVLIILFLTSCGDIQQDLRLNKDGSGYLETSIDIGELMSMTQGLGDMGFDQDSFTDDFVPDTVIAQPEPVKDAMTLLMDRITDPFYAEDFDSSMSILSLMPDSVRQKETRLDLLEKISIRLKSPANSGDLIFGTVMKFDNSKHLRELIDHMESFNQTGVSGSSPLSMDSGSFITFEADMKVGWIRVDTLLYTGFAEQMGMPQDTANVKSEDLGMMEMMFGNSKIKTVIHVPGEVLSCSIPNAILTKDNRVMIEFPMMDVIKRGKIDGYTIFFKP